MTTDAEDRSTWPRNGQVIRRDELLRLIEENGGSRDLDLRGTTLLGDGPTEYVDDNPLDLSPDGLGPLVAAYWESHECRPPWHSFGGGIALSGALMNGAYLENARLPHAYLGGTRLTEAVLDNVNLEHADLSDAHLEDARLENVKLQGANLLEAQLQMVHAAGADLSDAHLEDANLSFAVLEGSSLREATLWRTNLHGANLEQADLSGADLHQAELRHANVAGAELAAANLHYADLREAMVEGANLKEANLVGAQLQRTDMYEVRSLDGVHWYGAHLDHTLIKRESLGNAIGDEIEARQSRTAIAYREASEAYLMLKNNFNQIGRYEDASWAYVKEQQMEKMAYHREWRAHGWKLWRAWGSFWRWFYNRTFEFLTGYGERPWNAVRCGLITIFSFAVGYWLLGALSDHGRPGWFTSWSPADIDWAGFWDAVVYSLATFATFNLARPAMNPEGRFWEAASSLEAILGISVLALVVFTLGNRMSRG